MNPYTTPRRSSGFTLIELMVTLVLAVVLMSIAVPSFVSYRRNSELTGVTNNFVAALNASRTEAMKRNLNAMVVPSNLDGDWKKGWIVFVDMNRNNTFDSGTDIVIYNQEPPEAHINIVGTGTAAASPLSYVMYDASGFSKDFSTGNFAALSLNISRNDVAATAFSQVRRIKIARTGRVRVCTPKAATDTTCSSSDD
jgi:type IV fimbrial biogenesis protein FimT